MTIVEKRHHVNATAEQIYQVLMDFPSYSDWNPMVVKIEGDPSPSSTISAHIKIGARVPQVFTPVVLTNEPNRELRWVGTLLTSFLFRGEHFFIIEPEAEGGCTFIHGENFTGILQPLVSFVYGDELQKAFESFNVALKTKVEERVSANLSS